MKKPSDLSEAAKTLNKSLDSRRSSSNSKKGLTAGFLGESVRRGDSGGNVGGEESLRRQASQRGLGIESSTAAATAATSPQLEQEHQQQQSQVRKDLLWGP